MRVDVQVDLDSRKATIDLNAYEVGLYEKWMESGKDDIFEDLADSINDKVAEAMEFTIEDVRPSIE